jgi:hypothetical protein
MTTRAKFEQGLLQYEAQLTVNSLYTPKFIFAAMSSQPFSAFSSVEKESCFESEHEFCYRVQTMAKSKIP